MKTMMELTKYLESYNDISCPDNFYLAWRVLFTDLRRKDRSKILKEALADLEEIEQMSRSKMFSKGQFIPNKRPFDDVNG